MGTKLLHTTHGLFSYIYLHIPKTFLSEGRSPATIYINEPKNTYT